jgi:hypothetical protein
VRTQNRKVDRLGADDVGSVDDENGRAIPSGPMADIHLMVKNLDQAVKD